jgi:hypothetical protein
MHRLGASHTLLANSDDNVGSNAFLSTLMNDVALFCCEPAFADGLSFDFAIATIDCCRPHMQLVGKV